MPDEVKVEDLKKGLTEIKTTLDTQVKGLDSQLKQALGELEASRKTIASLEEKTAAIQRAQAVMQTVQRAGLTPVQRVVGNEVLRNHMNAAVRYACGQKLSEAHKKALGEQSSPGSTLINAQLAMEIYDLLETYGAWSTLGVRPVGTRVTKFPVKTSRPVAGWIMTESGEISDDTNKQGTSVDLTVGLVAVLLNVSRELLADAEYDVSTDVMNDFAEAISYRLDYAAFVGDATADTANGGYTGIFSGGTAAVAGDGNNAVGKLQLADFVRVLTTVPAEVLKRGARWYMHPQQLARVMNVTDNNKRPLFQTALEAPAPGGIGSILGYPVVPVNVAPNVDGAEKAVAAFGDPQAMVIGVRSDMELTTSEQYKWNFNQISYRGLMRAGVKLRAATGFAILKTAK